MRRLVTTAALTLALTAGGSMAATAQAAPAAHAASTVTTAVTSQDGPRTLAAGSSTLSEHQQAQEPSKRRYRTKTTKRRGFMSRIFGFMGFLLCLPLLLILVIALVMMMRRNNRRRTEQMSQQQFPQQTPYQQGRRDENDPYGR